MNLKDMVSGNKLVRFSFYREGQLWYKTECGFEFPVPTDPNEIGTAVFLAEDKALLFMRYIRKHLDYLNKAKQEQAGDAG